MSYIRAPRLHQSTALLCPLLIKISGALQQREGTSLTNELVLMSQQEACKEKQSGKCAQGEKMREHGLHVLDGTAESVGDCAVVNRLFAQPEVCQLHVAWEENNTDSDGYSQLPQI